jgi:long-chain acyl-CoA synthetase
VVAQRRPGPLDADGFLHVSGRKKNLLITAFGRNVSPEWVETALRSHPACCRRWSSATAQPALSAVLWPHAPDATDAHAAGRRRRRQRHLPDYARIAAGCAAVPPSTPPAAWPPPTAGRSARHLATLHADALRPGPLNPTLNPP